MVAVRPVAVGFKNVVEEARKPGTVCGVIQKMMPFRIALFLSLSVYSGMAQELRLPGSGTAPIPVGGEIAVVTAYDAEGNPFPLRKGLAGRHAVLVFGCLT